MSYYPYHGPPQHGPPNHGPPHHGPPHHGPPHHGHHGYPPPPPHGYLPPTHGYPPPPHVYPTPPHAYVPVPYVVPAYPAPSYPPVQENPTYITNYIVQPAEPVAEPPPAIPEQVQVVDNPPAPYLADVIDWLPATTSTALNFSSRAVVAGHEGWDGSPLWVIRAHQGGELLPGKFSAKHRIAYVPNGGRELSVHNFEILCATPGSVRWLPSSDGQVPVGAISAGNTMMAEPLYIGRAKHMNSLTPGKIHPSHHCCYISFGGQEVSLKHYEVLCKIVG